MFCPHPVDLFDGVGLKSPPYQIAQRTLTTSPGGGAGASPSRGSRTCCSCTDRTLFPRCSWNNGWAPAIEHFVSSPHPSPSQSCPLTPPCQLPRAEAGPGGVASPYPPSLSESQHACSQALAELQEVFSRLPSTALGADGDRDPFAVLWTEILRCREQRIVVFGVGREGLMLRALAMRLFHLGLHVAVVGDMAAPAVGPRDLFLASAGPGSFASVDALLGVARRAGARTLLLTAQPDGAAAELADAVAHLPAQTMADDLRADGKGERILPMGSVYEGALFILCEVVVWQLRECLQESAQSVRARHTNLE